jgi:hypothetical protein
MSKVTLPWIILAMVLAALLVLAYTPTMLGAELRYNYVPSIMPIIPPRDYMNVRMEVLVDGRPLPTVSYRGRTYLPVPELGVEYQIRVNNHGTRRIAAMVSVDGLSVINGKPASEYNPGYIVDPGSHIVIKGWRRNLETVAAFSFEERENSYAYRVGRSDNIGVIGLIAVEEQSYS